MFMLGSTCVCSSRKPIVRVGLFHCSRSRTPPNHAPKPRNTFFTRVQCVLNLAIVKCCLTTVRCRSGAASIGIVCLKLIASWMRPTRSL